MLLAPSKLDSNANKVYSLQYLMLKSNFLHERSQVLTDILLKMQVFQDVTCHYTSLSSCFEGSQCIHLQSQAVWKHYDRP
jgi:hypothetical protein